MTDAKSLVVPRRPHLLEAVEARPDGRGLHRPPEVVARHSRDAQLAFLHRGENLVENRVLGRETEIALEMWSLR